MKDAEMDGEQGEESRARTSRPKKKLSTSEHVWEYIASSLHASPNCWANYSMLSKLGRSMRLT